MHISSVSLLLAVAVPTAFATIHTACYNYFLHKDGCVFSAADARNRCPAESKPCPGPAVQFKYQPQASQLQKRGEVHTLTRRYDTTEKSFPVAGGSGICGDYDTNEDEGACLWAGTSASGADPTTAGWLNGAKTSNCGKRLYIQRRGLPTTVVYAPLRDGCTFNTFNVTIGCFQIALTNRTFNALNPTPEERARQAIDGITWDFDNLHGYSPQQGPV